MNRLWLVFSYEFIRNIKRKGYLFATLGLPLIAILIFIGYPVYQSFQSPEEETNNVLNDLSLERLERAGIVDYSGVFANPPERFAEVLVPYADEDAARIALEAEEIDVFLVFPANYLETGDAVLHMPDLNITIVGEGQSIAEQLAYSTFASGLDEARLRRLSNPAIFTDFDLSVNAEGSNSQNEDADFWFVYAFAMVFFISLILTNTYLMQTVIEERDNRMVEILISTIKPTDLLGGKILAMASMGLLQILCWIAAGVGMLLVAENIDVYATVLQNVEIDLNPGLFALMAFYFVLMYLTYASVFGTIGAVSGSAQEGSQYAGFLVIPAMIPFYFMPILQNDPNGLVSTVLSIVPVTAPITILARTVIAGVPAWQIGLSIGLLIILAGASMWMAGRVFRVQTLLSGTKLKVSDIPRLIFASS